MDKPKLRNLDMFAVEVEGRQMVCLRDPLNVTPGLVFVPPEVFAVVMLFDGSRSFLDIQTEFANRTGSIIFNDKVGKIVSELDSKFLLDSPAFHARLTEVESAFLSSPMRRSAHAGGAYPPDAVKLWKDLQAMFSDKGGGGVPKRKPASRDKVAGIIAPHIDFERGKPGYARAYKALGEFSDAELFVIFGTYHGPMSRLFSVTDKEFETPLGTTGSDRDAVSKLVSLYGRERLGEEAAHRVEHSIEFQVVMLQFLQGIKREFRILPVLCGNFDRFIAGGKSPADDPEVRDFTAALKEVVKDGGVRTAYIAGADLSHVGVKFGDDVRLSAGLTADVEKADMEMLGAVERLDAAAFFEAIRGDGNKRHVCGVAPICMLLSAMEAKTGHLLHYGVSKDVNTQSLVSYAAMSFS
jgi:AmmeMemoRadiSam system protein B